MYTVQESKIIKRYMVKGPPPPFSLLQGAICPGPSTFQLAPCLVSRFLWASVSIVDCEKNIHLMWIQKRSPISSTLRYQPLICLCSQYYSLFSRPSQPDLGYKVYLLPPLSRLSAILEPILIWSYSCHDQPTSWVQRNGSWMIMNHSTGAKETRGWR